MTKAISCAPPGSMIVAVTGVVNSGKSSAINKLLGEECAPVSPFPGYHDQLSLYALSKGIVIADAPGTNGPRGDTRAKARQVMLKRADLALFFINGAQGLTTSDRQHLRQVRSYCNALVVCNRVDQIGSKGEIALAIKDMEDTLKCRVLPLSALQGAGVARLRSTIKHYANIVPAEPVTAKSFRAQMKDFNARITNMAQFHSYFLPEKEPSRPEPTPELDVIHLK